MSITIKENRPNTKNRIDFLINEVMNGKYPKAKLPNASYDFSDELQANYFVNARQYLNSDVAHMVFENNQQLDELKLLKEWAKDDK